MTVTFPPVPVRSRYRRLALAIGLPFVLLAIVWGALGVVSLVGRDSYQVSSTVIPASSRLTANVGSGNVTIAPSHDGQSRYRASVHYSLFRPNLHWRTSADRVVLSGQPLCLGWSACGVNLHLTVPAHRPIDTGSASGDVRVKDLTGSVNVHAGSGDVLANRLSGPLQLVDSSGDITGTALTSPRVQAKGTSGNIRLSFARPPERVQLHDSSGDITLAVPGNVSYFIDAKTSSGTTNIRVPQNPNAHRKITVRDISGDITVVPYPGSR